MATPEDLQRVINSQTLETFWTHHLVCFYSRGNQHISANGTIFFIRQNILCLPSAVTDVEKQSRSVLSAGTVQCVCRIMCMHGCAYVICVWWREEVGDLCVLRHHDWLVSQRQRQDVKILQYTVKPTGSSPDSWISIQPTKWTACMLIGKDSIYRWVECNPLWV